MLEPAGARRGCVGLGIDGRLRLRCQVPGKVLESHLRCVSSKPIGSSQPGDARTPGRPLGSRRPDGRDPPPILRKGPAIRRAFPTRKPGLRRIQAEREAFARGGAVPAAAWVGGHRDALMLGGAAGFVLVLLLANLSIGWFLLDALRLTAAVFTRTA